ncbi:hypothetical protein GCM10022226_68620 [Sphaerisporangium flaviroseum]|uniref:HTH luxR-type domain-containing protein n=1 Tax=Sphaerisporangium flaviroseum TaxID=509199 RepID=A0ABP7J8H2_9ACTN
MTNSTLLNVGNGLALQLYRTARGRGSWDASAVAAEVGAEIFDVEAAISCLEELGLLVPSPRTPAGYMVVNPDVALFRLLDFERTIAANYQRESTHCREALNVLLRDYPEAGSRANRLTIEPLRTPAELAAFLDHRSTLVKKRKLVIHPDLPMAETAEHMMSRDVDALARGVKLRAIYSAHVVPHAAMRDYCMEVMRCGADIRVAGYLPLRMIVMDDDLALLPSDPQSAGNGYVAVHSTEVVKSMSAVFAHHWSAASPIASLQDSADDTGGFLSGQEQAIIQMLAIGIKDEVIARRLGVSRRTLTRAISTLLDRLAVETRFQAAMKVTKMGLLTGEP